MKSAEYQKSHVSALLPLLVPGLVLAVSSISYFNFLSYTKLIIYSIIIAGGVCALFFTLSGEYKWRRNVLAVIIIFAVLYAPSVIAQLNYAFDSPEPNHVNAKVTEILYDSDYDLKADLNDGTEISYKFKVLGNYEVGDTIDIVKKEGFFDIPYADEGFKQLQLIFNRNFVLILNDAMMEKLGPMSLEDQLINESQKIKNKS